MIDSKVLILMATYNGEQFLEEQLRSIIDQNYADWNLIISDDCFDKLTHGS
jgi:rhamnosyltransferase